ncbi:SMP-30/gluconolactonase/LRE family protein [Chelatococcus reniformis]|uniref:Gluconolactonase n=1 Tax=Chelatococcus reniformis TaxID=1494448 RepID=A0A916TWU4_9HYPH|nr:SMP-30/gluconolactonase/LRE family protein [Chelatococcus reniformis]GGC48360.1 gluconolactonase [Chelatococcus reniformis]
MKPLARGLEFPEGPVAMGDGSVILCEIVGGRLTRVAADGKTDVVANLGGGPNGAAIGPDGRIYVCNNGGAQWEGGRIDVVDPRTGKWDVLYDNVDGHRLAGPNDIVFDTDDGFYFTDFGKTEGRVRHRGGIFWAKADGSHIREVIFPFNGDLNGIGLSPDNKTLYATETAAARVWSWEIIGPGSVRRRPFPAAEGATLVAQLPGVARFDSMAVSQSGKILVGTLRQGGITEICPLTGAYKYYFLPDFLVTNLCFGGPDMTTCFVTMAHSGQLVELNWHEPGLRLSWQQPWQGRSESHT